MGLWLWLVLAAVSARKFSDEEYAKVGSLLSRGAARVEVAVESGGAAQLEVADDDAGGIDALMAKFAAPSLALLQTAASDRLRGLLEDTETDECRRLVAAHFTDVYARLLNEDSLPFESQQFRSDCSEHGAPKSAKPLLDAKDVRIAYLLIVHEQEHQIRRLIAALQERDQHNFIIHVDGKSASTYEALRDWSLTTPNVHVLETGRTNISWGGFNIVRATLTGLEYVVDHLDGQYDWISTISGYTYPLASNPKIRETLAQYPADSEFLEIRPTPNEPQPRAWHQNVECDNRMRRIWRLQPAQGIKMYMGSQWMTITREFAQYVTHRGPYAGGRFAGTSTQTFAKAYEKYGIYTMVADENFFVTVLKNSPFCGKHVNKNFLHVQFDQWEHEKLGKNNKKCLQPNPKHCGRSPTTLTLDYMPVLDLGKSLFARKFDPDYDAAILDAVDTRRQADVEARLAAGTAPREPDEQWFPRVRISQPSATRIGREQCLTVGADVAKFTKRVTLEPCESANPRQLFQMGPCSTDGLITLDAGSGLATVEPGQYTPAPFCPINLTPSAGTSYAYCLDLQGEKIVPMTPIIAFPCSGRWNQLFAMGASSAKPLPGKPRPGSLYINIPFPQHVPKELCLENGGSVSNSLHVTACNSGPRQVFSVNSV